ncbi:GerAB/ArcD/ProY family transporter [Paenibacillus sedimenti]|uniref:Endospore germination permease n=1 Tax=Paenibacillus sedimenti TaxID=2770274 RepID=A0A926KU46_9BACL|nr:endospore germination permease [Paenibacillus sedimenti]MBD0383176.1 endospore germination permease [Paenibacillus sedimenti]
MEKGVERLPNTGFAAVMYMFLLGSTLTLPLAAVAGHDAWISILLAIAVSLGIVWMYSHLCQLYPGKNLIEIGEELFGVWIGRLIGICYAWYAFHLGVMVVRNFTELILMVALPKTPPVVIAAVMVATVLWAAYAGIEVLARCSIFILGFVLTEGMFSIIFMGKDFQPSNLLPVIDKGWTPILQGMTGLIGFPLCETVLFAMIIPQLNKIEQAKKTVLWTTVAGGLLLLLINIRNTLILGELSSRLIYPSYTAYQYISIADFIERVEPAVIFTWVMGGFVKICVCLYVSAKSLTTILSSKRFRTYLVPLSILMLLYSRIIYRNNAEMIFFAGEVYQWYVAPFEIIIPLLMLLAAAWAKRKKKPSSLSEEGPIPEVPVT